jgi:hypothetical protein
MNLDAVRVGVSVFDFAVDAGRLGRDSQNKRER